MPCLAGNGNEERRLGGAELGRDVSYVTSYNPASSRADTGSTQELRSTTSSSVRR